MHVPPLGRSRPTGPQPAPAPEEHERAELRALLGLPRPRTRGECLQEARPCPWVACRHHLLLEVTQAQRTRSHPGPGLVLQAPSTSTGPRRQLSPTAPEMVVQRWIADALERLVVMRTSCSLDRADQGAAQEVEVAELVARDRRTMRRRRRAAIRALAERAKHAKGYDENASSDPSDCGHIADINRGSSGQPPALNLKNSGASGRGKTAK